MPCTAHREDEEPLKVLHIIATPRGENSNTLQIANAFLDGLTTHQPRAEIERLDLFELELPPLAGDAIETKYTLMAGQAIEKTPAWQQIETLIAHFLAADVYVISAPMWNFAIPYVLKYYIDCIVQPGYVFRIGENGMPVPLVHGKKMVCVTARGADYSASSPMHALDFQEPYLRSIFGFIGITDVEFISVQPTDISSQREAAFTAALAHAQKLAGSAEWNPAAALIAT